MEENGVLQESEVMRVTDNLAPKDVYRIAIELLGVKVILNNTPFNTANHHCL